MFVWLSEMTEERPRKRARTERKEVGREWEEKLKNVTVGSLCEKKQTDLILIDKDATLKDALGKLSKNKILSVPVVDGKEFLGFVDVLDIVGFLLKVYKKSLMEDSYSDFHSIRKEFFQRNVIDCINFSRCDRSIFINETDTLYKAVKKFVQFQPLHRLAVVKKQNDGKMHLCNILTQSDIIAFACRNINTISTELASAELSSLRVIRTSLLIRIDSPFLEALQFLYDHRVSGIALIDAECRVSCCLSASDLRGVNEKAFEYFLGSTLQFLVKATDSAMKPPISCTPQTTLKEAMSTLSSNSIHRIFITNSSGHISGVASMSDILARIAPK
eukprot:TRINITY_DN2598_c0_g1_i1.p1 TRINITY_DN2598_c0_g1~~TRINITY_DN2598_c0_g1_i1.p1  ORF type:complete len:331 (-),score=58.41 TRINITY_DN2598_c0_g1_i1:139-1131(-)